MYLFISHLSTSPHFPLSLSLSLTLYFAWSMDGHALRSCLPQKSFPLLVQHTLMFPSSSFFFPSSNSNQRFKLYLLGSFSFSCSHEINYFNFTLFFFNLLSQQLHGFFQINGLCHNNTIITTSIFVVFCCSCFLFL